MWLSVYIFHKNHIYSYESDRIILEVVKPFVEMCEKEKLIEKYFFIRYSENGPHIRLRLEVDNSDQLNTLKVMLTNHITVVFPRELHIEENNPWNNNSVYQFIEYQPETERYGGEEGIKIAEEYFYYSSKIAINLIGKINYGDNSERLAKAIIVDVVILKKFIDDINHSVLFLTRYSTGYLYNLAKEEKDGWLQAFDRGFEKQATKISEFVSQLCFAINNGLNIDDDINELIFNIEKIKKALQMKCKANNLLKNSFQLTNWQDIITYLFPSYLHMMNNRIGISVSEESYVAHLINNAFNKIKSIEISQYG